VLEIQISFAIVPFRPAEFSCWGTRQGGVEMRADGEEVGNVPEG
jgi:hypothetical protein